MVSCYHCSKEMVSTMGVNGVISGYSCPLCGLAVGESKQDAISLTEQTSKCPTCFQNTTIPAGARGVNCSVCGTEVPR